MTINGITDLYRSIDNLNALLNLIENPNKKTHSSDIKGMFGKHVKEITKTIESFDAKKGVESFAIKKMKTHLTFLYMKSSKEVYELYKKTNLLDERIMKMDCDKKFECGETRVKFGEAYDLLSGKVRILKETFFQNLENDSKKSSSGGNEKMKADRGEDEEWDKRYNGEYLLWLRCKYEQIKEPTEQKQGLRKSFAPTPEPA